MICRVVCVRVLLVLLHSTQRHVRLHARQLLLRLHGHRLLWLLPDAGHCGLESIPDVCATHLQGTASLESRTAKQMLHQG